MGRLTVLVVAMAVAGAAAPAAARTGKSRGATRPAASAVELVPLHSAACLPSIPGQECVEDHDAALCTAPAEARAPAPVVVDCRDPSVEWVQEMVGVCDMPPAPGEGPALTPARDHSRDAACVDGEACSAPRPYAAAGNTSFDAQPVALARAAHLARFGRGDRLGAAVPVRRDPGYPPRLLRPPNG